MTQTATLRHEYTQLLRDMMSAMKSNYQELRQEPGTSGAYVRFVHRVVEVLQEHVIDICPVDRFFTDSTAFPLPATDPTYVVGRLKNYGLRLAEPRVYKQLVYFVQSVSERTAVDHQQEYLVKQLRTAMCETYESSTPERPTLRSFLIHAIFPAYMELALSTPTGWILASPILQSTSFMLENLLSDFSIDDPTSVASVTSIITTILSTLRQTVELLVDHSGLLEQNTTLKTVAQIFHCVSSCLVPMNYIHLVCHTSAKATSSIDFFRAFALFVTQHLTGSEEITSPYHISLLPVPPSPTSPSLPRTPDQPFSEIRHFATHELRDSLTKNWVRHGEAYYLLRGTVRKEVVVEIGDQVEEKRGVLRAVERFERVLERMAGSGGGMERRRRRWMGD